MREACNTCHDPHGSNNERMLVAKPPMLCQRCHIGTRHPSTILAKMTPIIHQVSTTHSVTGATQLSQFANKSFYINDL